MLRKILLISLVSFGLLFFQMASKCLADVSAQFERAKSYEKNQDYEQAEVIYKTIVQNYEDTDYALKAQKNLAILYIRLQRETKVQAVVDGLITNFSGHSGLPKTLYDIAKKHEQWKYGKARRIYQQLVQHYPDNSHAKRAQLDISRLNVQSLIDSRTPKNHTEMARKAITKMLEDFSGHPDMPETLYSTAKRYEWWGKYTEQGRGKYDEQNGWEYGRTWWVDYEQAKNVYQQIVQRYPDSSKAGEARLNVSRINIISLIYSAQTEQAQTAIDKLITDFPEHTYLPEVLYNIAETAERVGEYEQAKSVYQQIIQRYPDSTQAEKAPLNKQRSEILIFIDDGNDIEAHAAVDKMLTDFGDHRYLSTSLSWIASQKIFQIRDDPNSLRDKQVKEHFTKALAVWDKIMKRLPASALTADAYYFTGVCFNKLHNYEKTIEYYQKVVDNWPKSKYAWSAQSLIGSCYGTLGNLGRLPKSEAEAKMEQAYKTSIEKYPNGGLANRDALKLGELNFARSQWAEAAMYFELFLQKPVKVTGQHQRIDAVYKLGQAYEKMEQFDRAVKLYKEFIKTYPGALSFPNESGIKEIKIKLEELAGQGN